MYFFFHSFRKYSIFMAIYVSSFVFIAFFFFFTLFILKCDIEHIVSRF